MGDKIYQLVVKGYHYLLVSFYFWIGLFRGFIIYGLIPSLASLYLTLQYMRQNPDHDEAAIKKAYWNYYRQRKHHKLSSFLVSLSMILLFSLIFFFYKEALGWVLIGIASYFLLLILATISYASYYLAFKDLSIKDAFALGFVSVIKNLGISLLIIIMNAVMILLALYNIVLFIVVFPALYGSIIIYVFSKRLE